MVGLVAGGAAVVGALGSVVSSSNSAGAAREAAAQQAAAAERAAQIQVEQQRQTRDDLLPYNTAGQKMLPALSAYSADSQGKLNTAWDQVQAAIPKPMTQANLEATPGYQFNLAQGLKATQNAAAARGLGVSSAALRGAANYATGLADSTYQNQFNNAQTLFTDANAQYTNRLNQYNQGWGQMLPISQMGENAGAMVGYEGTQAANYAGTNIANAGAAQAAGTTVAANNTGAAINAAANAPLNYLAWQQALSTDKPKTSAVNSVWDPING